MTHTTSAERIEQQATEAAQTYDNVNDACPYPFFTQAGREFKAAFERARIAAMQQQNKESA